jgi:hypothetical protein
MKADVPRPPKLPIPAWVPEPVASIFGNDAGVVAGRLLRDPRMRNVWKPLLSRRPDGRFMHSASVSVRGANAQQRQGAAMAELFHYVVCATMWPGTITTRSKAEQKRRRFLAKAEELRADAEMWLRDAPADAPFGLWTNDFGPDTHWRRLMDASEAYKEIAAEAYAGDMRMALDRARGDGDVRWFALAVADKCRSLFGSPMYGVTSTLVSVALGRKVGHRLVREWCATADKAQKKRP